MNSPSPRKSFDKEISGDLRVMCVGSCDLDIIFDCTRYPQENYRHEIAHGRWQRGGRASTICTILRRLGSTCEFLGMLSNSPSYQYLSDDFNAYNIITENCPLVAVTPPFNSVILARRKGTSTIIRSPDNLPTLTHQHFLAAMDYRRYNWVHFQAREPDETLRMMRDVHAFSKRSGQRIVVSTDLEKDCRSSIEMAELGDYVFISRSYLSEMCWQNLREACLSIRDILKQKKELLGRKQNIICADGLRGTACLDANGRFTEFPPHRPKHIVETYRSNEVFVAAVIFILSQGMTNKLHEAVDYAVRLEGLKMGMTGFDGINFSAMKKGAVA